MDVPVDVVPEVTELVLAVRNDMQQQRSGYAVSERIRDGFEVAILGPPNAGKSTLLNQLAGREAALTSEYAGTTRDVIEVRMDLAGLPVTLLDTAGVRDATDPVEAMGIARGLQRARDADLRIFLTAGDEVDLGLHPLPDDLVVRGKSDLNPGDGMAVSGLTGAGISALVAEVGRILSGRVVIASVLTRTRHRLAVERSIGALEKVLEMLQDRQGADEMIADALRQAINAMDDLVGRIGVEDLLGEIFSSFCIGK